MIQNERFGTGLKQYLPYAKIIDQTKTSDQYFRLFDVPDKLYVGKNSFRIRINRNTLVQGSLLYIDVVDSIGEIIYHEITELTGEDGSRLIVIHIYEDTPPGEATIYIAGRASYDTKNKKNLSYSTDPASSTEYIDFPNIFWQGKVVVIPTAETENEIIFAQPPTIRIKERFEEYKTYQSGANRKVELTGSLKVSINPTLTSYDYSDSSKSGIKISENSLQVILDPKTTGNVAESKQVSLSRYSDTPTLYDSNGNFTEDFRGGEIVIRNLTAQLNVSGVTVPDFSCSIIEVIDRNNVKIWPPFKYVYGSNNENVFKNIKDATNVTASYYTTKTELATNDSESFVQLEFDNLEPLAGKVDSVSISYKPYGTFGEFVPIGEFKVKTQEYLIDSSSLVLSKAELIERPIGKPTGSTDFDNYWEIIDGKYQTAYDASDNPFSGQGVLIKSTNPTGDDISYDFKMKLKNGYGVDVVANTEFKLEFTLGLPFPSSIRESGDLQLDVFISGSSILRDTIENRDSVKLLDDLSEGERISSLTKKTSAGVTTYTYYFKTVSSGKIYPVFLFKNALYISIKNISIQPRNELGFSPNQARLFVPLETLKTNTELVFNVEYLNKKKERSKVSSQVYGLFFSGSGLGSTIIDNGLNNSPVFQIISSSIGDQAVKVSGSTLYSYNPSTTQFSLTDSIFFGTGSGFQATNAYASTFLGKRAGYQATSANNSVFIGNLAGNLASAASASFFLGNQAGNGATNAFQSTFLGTETGQFASSAQNSIFIGYRAGRTATSARDSFFAGSVAGSNASSANQSVFIGNGAGTMATNANNSNFIGFRSGQTATNAFSSNFLGQFSGYSATAASYCNFLGEYSGYEAAQPQHSNFIGAYSGYRATNANNSNFMGFESGRNGINSSGSNFIGYRSGYNTTTAGFSNFIGYEAGFTASAARFSNFIGYQSGYSASQANNSNFFGREAGYQAINANNAVFIGQDSGYRATNAVRSVFIGQNSGFTASAASDSIFMGHQSGYRATNAASSIFLGNATGQDARDSIFSNFIGSSAGYQATNSPGSNFIGLVAGALADTASFSNFIGAYAGFSATASTGSNFIGFQAGIGSSEFGGEGLPPKRQFNSSYSNFIGWTAGALASTASYSNFIGYEAGISASNSSYSNFIGFNAGRLASAAQFSNFIGTEAGEFATSASYSNFLGFQAGLSANNATDSNFLGYQAGFAAYAAFSSNFIGSNTGYLAQSASFSNFIGYHSGQSATNASQSNFIGHEAGVAAANANNSNFIGNAAGYLATNASQSNFIGYEAGYQATNAVQSNFIGQRAGYLATNSSGSTFIGNGAGQNATNAPTSVFIGPAAGLGATFANSSNIIGRSAGTGAAYAEFSNFIGRRAGSSASSASYSNFIGFQAGIEAINANNSTFIGYEAGYQAISASYSNFIGFRAGQSQGSALSPNLNNIIIGSAITVPAGSSNRINIAGLIFGSGSYFPADINSSIIFSGSANGRIGINQPNPQKELDISGSVRISNLSTLLTAPPTSGTQKMVITDANGDLSFKDIPSGSEGGGSGSVAMTIIDESTNLGTATHLKFEGAGVTTTLSNSTASISIPGGSGSSGVFVIDETSNLGSASYLKFEGAGVTATMSNNTASISISGGSGSAFPYIGDAQITGSLGIDGNLSISQGSIAFPIKSISSGSYGLTYNVTRNDYTLLVEGGIQINLPSSTGELPGRTVIIKKDDYGYASSLSGVIVSASSGDRLEGLTSKTLVNSDESITIQLYSKNWYIVSKV